MPQYNVQGVVIGIGPDWEMPAALAAVRLEATFSVRFAVMNRRPLSMPEHFHPAWAKLWAFEVYPHASHLIVADADLLPVAPIERNVLDFDADFSAVLDEPSRSIFHESEAFGIPPNAYFNTGLFMARRKTMAPILTAAQRRGPRYGAWLEQTAINVGIHAAEARINVWPHRMNWQCPPGASPHRCAAEGAEIIHFSGRRGNAARVSQEIESVATDLAQEKVEVRL